MHDGASRVGRYPAVAERLVLLRLGPRISSRYEVGCVAFAHVRRDVASFVYTRSGNRRTGSGGQAALRPSLVISDQMELLLSPLSSVSPTFVARITSSKSY